MSVKMEVSQPNPPLERIKEVERVLGLSFPDSYIRTLALCNGARPEANVFEQDSKMYGVTKFFEVSEIPHQKELLDRFNPSDRLPIAYSEGGNYICLGTSGDEVGLVFFVDHEIPGGKAYTKIADSIEDFLERLRPFDISEVAPAGGIKGVSWIDPEFLKSLKLNS